MIEQTRLDTTIRRDGTPGDDGVVVVSFPPREWTPAVSDAAERLPPRNRPRKGSTVLDRWALDLARVDYVAQELVRSGGRHDNVGRSPLLMDLSRVTSIAYGVLPMLGALLKYRSDEELITYLRLPVGIPEDRLVNPVIDYLRTWQFGEFLWKITGRQIDDFLTPESRLAWSEWTPESSTYAETRAYGARRLQVLSKKSLCLTQLSEADVTDIGGIQDADERRYRAAQAVSGRVSEWTRGVLGSLLKPLIVDRNGKSASEMVGATILNELLINSVVHPSAKHVYTCGQFCPPVKGFSDRWYFVLSVWDNAADRRSLGQRLFAAARADRAASPAFGRVREVFHVWHDGKWARRVEVADRTLASDLVDELKDAPFGATVPGITSEPSAGATGKWMDLDGDDLPSEYQGFSGLGLYRVRLVVVRAIGGFMEYSGSTLRTEIRAARNRDIGVVSRTDAEDSHANDLVDGHYRIDQRSDKRECWPLAGNLWTVWLPVALD